MLEKLRHKKIAILGFGIEGYSTFCFLQKHNITDITILDNKEIDSFDPEKKEAIVSTDHVLGEKYMDDLGQYDIIFKTAGISPYNEKILACGDKVLTQAQLFFHLYTGKVIAVSGTKGKSTTASLIYGLLQRAGKSVHLIGNIGKPVLDFVEIESEFVVFEMSSYHLESAPDIAPFISVLVNIYPDHLDFHHGFENYKAAKINIFGKGSYEILHQSLQVVTTGFDNTRVLFGHSGDFWYDDTAFYHGSLRIAEREHVVLQGDHNASNICAVFAVADFLDIPFEEVISVITTFTGLPHRIQLIAEKNDIRFIDDAISTTPESTMEALKTFGKQVSTIFLGGSDRGYDFSSLAHQLEEFGIKNIVLFPESGQKILPLVQKFAVHILQTESMQQAVEFAFEHTGQGKICLLSCASPSYSLWENYKQKGKLFQKYIEAY